MITENGLKLFASNEPLEVRSRLSIVTNLTKGSSIFDIRQVRHRITNCDSSQGGRGEASNIGFYLQLDTTKNVQNYGELVVLCNNYVFEYLIIINHNSKLNSSWAETMCRLWKFWQLFTRGSSKNYSSVCVCVFGGGGGGGGL